MPHSSAPFSTCPSSRWSTSRARPRCASTDGSSRSRRAPSPAPSSPPSPTPTCARTTPRGSPSATRCAARGRSRPTTSRSSAAEQSRWPPVFFDRVVAAIVAHLFDASGAPIERRAAQLLYRRQRVAIVEGRVLCADAEHADRASAAAGELDLVRDFVRRGDVGGMPILGAENAHAFEGPPTRMRSFSTSATRSRPTSATA